MKLKKFFITMMMTSAMVVVSVASLACEEHEAKAVTLEPSTGVLTLHDNPQAVKEEGGEKLTSALDQLSKTADRFHHIAEENNFTAASEVLDILKKQQALTQALYLEPFQVEP